LIKAKLKPVLLKRHESGRHFYLVHGKKGFGILTKSFVKISITKTFCYNNKVFSSVSKTFGCCSKIFGCSNKNFICCPNFVAVTNPFFPCSWFWRWVEDFTFGWSWSSTYEITLMIGFLAKRPNNVLNSRFRSHFQAESRFFRVWKIKTIFNEIPNFQ